MTPSDLADEQLKAAWISAGAAVIQAIGAIGAIVASILLARGSAKREREANAAAVSRAQAADRAASDRADAADRAAEARIERSKIEGHNRLVDRISALGRLLMAEQEAWFSEEKVRYNESRATIVGGLMGQSLNDLRNAIPEIKSETSDAQFIAKLNILARSLIKRDFSGEGGRAYLNAAELIIQDIRAALAEVETCRQS